MKNILQGVVVSDRCDKTISVMVYRKVWHKIYKKLVKRRKKYLVHDEKNQYSNGDSVVIKSTSPISARKTWIVIEGDKV